MELQERDCEIIRLVHRHRFLRSEQIIALLGDSRQQVLRRLQTLYHHGFLERPRAQLRYYDPDVPRSIVYGLGRKGGTLLRQRFNLEVDPHSWSEQTHQVGRVYLEHALFVADVMVAVETSCRKRGDVKLIQEEDINISREKQPLPWRVTLHDGTKLGVVPDRVFALEYAGQNGQRERVFFFLEADRGTMPVKRHTLAQTSFYRKLLAYEATWSQGVHKRLGMNRIRVLTVTTSAMRVKSLAQAASSLERGHGLFLFADKSILSGDILSSLWQTAKPGEPRRLL